VLFYVLFVCKCVLYYCHRVTTQLQLTNISFTSWQMPRWYFERSQGHFFPHFVQGPTVPRYRPIDWAADNVLNLQINKKIYVNIYIYVCVCVCVCVNEIPTSLAGLLIITNGAKLRQDIAWWLGASFSRQRTAYILFILFIHPLFSFFHVCFCSLATLTYFIMQNHEFSVTCYWNM
jgi:hypothetical protein